MFGVTEAEVEEVVDVLSVDAIDGRVVYALRLGWVDVEHGVGFTVGTPQTVTEAVAALHQYDLITARFLDPVLQSRQDVVQLIEECGAELNVSFEVEADLDCRPDLYVGSRESYNDRVLLRFEHTPRDGCVPSASIDLWDADEPLNCILYCDDTTHPPSTM